MRQCKGATNEQYTTESTNLACTHTASTKTQALSLLMIFKIKKWSGKFDENLVMISCFQWLQTVYPWNTNY